MAVPQKLIISNRVCKMFALVLLLLLLFCLFVLLLLLFCQSRVIWGQRVEGVGERLILNTHDKHFRNAPSLRICPWLNYNVHISVALGKDRSLLEVFFSPRTGRRAQHKNK